MNRRSLFAALGALLVSPMTLLKPKTYSPWSGHKLNHRALRGLYIVERKVAPAAEVEERFGLPPGTLAPKNPDVPPGVLAL